MVEFEEEGKLLRVEEIVAWVYYGGIVSFIHISGTNLYTSSNIKV
jgi:hypothetical protein